MKKIATMLIVLMMIAGAPAWCLPGTVDHVIDHTMESDVRPVEDTGKILNAANKGIGVVYDTVTKPLDPVLNPIRKVRDHTMMGAKNIINMTWDIVTLQHFRAAK